MDGSPATGTRIFIGPAGWSYRDWIGPVYPVSGRIDQLLFIARLFNCIELNSSFYRVPGHRLVSSWARRLSDAGGFRFTVKVWQRFTHEGAGNRREIRTFIDSFEPLLALNRVGAFLLQFPWSFKNTAANRERLAHLGDWLSGCPAAVELRHGSWNVPDAFDLLAGSGLAFCNIDQPRIGDSMPPTDYVTNKRIAYIRLHGRNARNWFRKDAGRDERYDYCYNEDELAEWKKRISNMLGKTDTLFIITNNHFRGQALVNALQLKHLLEGTRVEVPTTLRRSYPSLDVIALDRPHQGSLLGDE
jgi:uncharacterized protein YecE (DUF72 family)